MKRIPQPFYRPKKNRWYVQLDGKQINLGPDKDAAWARYHELMVERSKPQESPKPSAEHPAVASVIDQYFGWLKARVKDGSKAERTLNWYQKYLVSFLRYLRSIESPPAKDSAEPPTLTVDQFQPIHIYNWVDAHPSWKTGKRGAMTAVQRAFNWAAKAGLLKSIGGTSPVKFLEKPAQGRREQHVTQPEYDEALALVHGQEFRDLLESSWETGARPHELFTVEKSFVDFTNSRWVFSIRESKGKKYQRVIYLPPRILEITQRLCLKNPEGPIFRNTDGKPWTAFSVNCRFRLLRTAIGRKRMREKGLYPAKIPRLTPSDRKDPKLRKQRRAAVLARRKGIKNLARKEGAKYSLYVFRHSFCTRVLEAGKLDTVTLSLLMGHRDTQMTSRVYSHLTQRPDYLREAANRAASG